MKKIVIAILFLIAGCNTAPNIGNLTVVNNSDSVIARGSVEVCNQKVDFLNVNNGESKIISFNVGADSEYKVSVEFKDGKALQDSFGYVTSGVLVNDKVVVESNKMTYQVGQKVKR